MRYIFASSPNAPSTGKKIAPAKCIHCTPEIDSTSGFSPECRWSSTLKTWRTRNTDGGDGLQQLPTRMGEQKGLILLGCLRSLSQAVSGGSKEICREMVRAVIGISVRRIAATVASDCALWKLYNSVEIVPGKRGNKR